MRVLEAQIGRTVSEMKPEINPSLERYVRPEAEQEGLCVFCNRWVAHFSTVSAKGTRGRARVAEYVLKPREKRNREVYYCVYPRCEESKDSNLILWVCDCFCKNFGPYCGCGAEYEPERKYGSTPWG